MKLPWRRPALVGVSLLFGATLAGLLLPVASVEAASPTETLRVLYVEANRIISTPQTEGLSPERLAEIGALFSKAFDSRGAAERALGPEWQARTAAEKSAFAALFAGFLQHGFIYWLGSVAAIDGKGGGMKIEYLGESVDHDRAAVKTAIAGRGGRVVSLDYDMIYEENRWVVNDVMINGVDLVANYRAQFERIVRTGSYRELIERLRERISSEPPRSASAAPEARGAVRESPGILQSPGGIETP